jgi:hypothetical protein
MADLLGGILSLVVAALFLGILAYQVPSAPLIIIIMLGFAMMVASLIESRRSDEGR